MALMKLKMRFIILFSCIAGFALYLLIHYGVLMNRGNVPSPVRQTMVLTERGPILDRNGRFLALQIRFADVGIWRPSISDIDVLANEFSPILEIPAEEIRNRINSSPSNFLYLQRQIDDMTARRLSAVIEDRRISGVTVMPVTGRLYPERNLASQVIGFVGDRNRGLEGIEFAFNDILGGIDGLTAGNMAAGNHANRVRQRGSTVMLTIDINVQHILERIAAQTLLDTGAEAVMFLAMDPRTGDILGSVSLPGFDPNDFRSSTAMSRMNRPAIWAFEPGSTFKVFSMAALLSAGAISSNTVFMCTGTYIPVRGAPINCLGVHGRVTAREIIVHSCNVGAALASNNVNNQVFFQMLSDFGFGARTGAGSPGETAGYLAPVENWSERSRQTIAFGQEIAVSAYQMLQAASAIANDGILVPPRIVLQTISADGRTVTPWESGPPRRILTPEAARAVRAYMADTASPDGQAWRAWIPDIPIGAKTGTAQMIDPVTLRYSQTDFISSCIALLPADNPSLVLYLAIIRPRGEIFGVRIAAPAIREAAVALIDYFGIPRGLNPEVFHPPALSIPSVRLPVVETHVPDFSGLAKSLLLPLLLREDIIAEIHGTGWVRRQYPPPGTPVTSGMKIILELE